MDGISLEQIKNETVDLVFLFISLHSPSITFFHFHFSLQTLIIASCFLFMKIEFCLRNEIY